MSGKERPPNLLAEALDRTAQALSGSPCYALIGGLAVAYHGLPRATRDIDVLLSIPRVALPPLLERFRERGFTFETEDVIRELGEDHLSKVHYARVRVDLLDAAIPFFRAVVGEWKVAPAGAGEKGNVLAQTAKSSGPTFNLVLVEAESRRDLDITVRMKSVEGETDQGGGIVWRARDAKNYYVARYNPLEENYRVYKVVDGKRTQLGSEDVPKEDGWMTLRVTMKGDHIQCFLAGKNSKKDGEKKLLDVKDATFADAGKIGLWTKADARTWFDDLKVREP